LDLHALYPRCRAAGYYDKNKPEGAIYAADLEELISLNGSGSDFEDSESDIKGIIVLEYCINLKEINLSYNQITDTSPLSGLTGCSIRY
jgi:hypothetical protein